MKESVKFTTRGWTLIKNNFSVTPDSREKLITELQLVNYMHQVPQPLIRRRNLNEFCVFV